jgi:3-hydroxybutyryl-CoA dehydrogenase
MIRNISIIGAGLMGHGIALTFARAGLRVDVHDPLDETRRTLLHRVTASMNMLGCDESEIDATRKRIAIHGNMRDAVAKADLVIEAAPEKLELKRSIFSTIESSVREDCILASNTSVLPITAIMDGLNRPERALGTHWWNPPHMIPLVEVIRTQSTSRDVVERTMAIL